jgi:transcriptional regulator with XRE-family HTH domain
MSTVAAETEVHQVFCANVRATIQARGITQHELALRLGITDASMSQIIGGRWPPGLDLVARVAKALETTPAALITPGKIPVDAS